MRSDVLLVVDVQPSFGPPAWLVERIEGLLGSMPSVATVERHDEARTPFLRQLGWAPGPGDESLIGADAIFVKHGYLPPVAAVDYMLALSPRRVLVCGMQTDTCVLAAGFTLFDAGLRPVLLTGYTVGSSLDRSGGLGADLWRHHFGPVLDGTPS